MAKTQRPRQNPILAAIETWLASLQSEGPAPEGTAELLEKSPKRFTTYEPMVLLPTGSFTSPVWVNLLGKLDSDTKTRLWTSILEQVSRTEKASLTNLATNDGIPLHDKGAEGAENVLRSPCGLRMLHGDFGPATLPDDPNWDEEFPKAFWTSTKQNGIIQTWAPRWTMFSRGNIKEKARLMGFPAVRDRTSQRWVIDLYAGIGYFVFSYAKLGFRVLCWEINPWSIEGLRRGALANGWSVKVVKRVELERPLEELIGGDEQIVVLSESNEEALRRMSSLGQRLIVEHVNCGFLPTSRPMWEDAWKMAVDSGEAWLHLHDNVGRKDVEERKEEIQRLCDGWADGLRQVAVVEHVEYVKTYAPDVWHCVFDVHITSS